MNVSAFVVNFENVNLKGEKERFKKKLIKYNNKQFKEEKNMNCDEYPLLSRKK